MSPQIHPDANCESPNVGSGTRVWANTHIFPDAVIGSDCNICEFVLIENKVVVGDRVTIKSGVQLWDGIIIHDNVFIGPNATFSNDKYPRSKKYPPVYLLTTLMQGASIGANATILPGLVIGEYALVGAGAVVTRDVPPYSIVTGNPAKITGYLTTDNKKEVSPCRESRSVDPIPDSTRLLDIPKYSDMRGDLLVVEHDSSFLPFTPARSFIVHNVPTSRVRGEHAHIECAQFLIALNGSLTVSTDDGDIRSQFTLSSPSRGLYVPPLVWASQFSFSSDAVLLVYASHHYDETDYIRTYDEFRSHVSCRSA